MVRQILMMVITILKIVMDMSRLSVMMTVVVMAMWSMMVVMLTDDAGHSDGGVNTDVIHGDGDVNYDDCSVKWRSCSWWWRCQFWWWWCFMTMSFMMVATSIMMMVMLMTVSVIQVRKRQPALRRRRPLQTEEPAHGDSSRLQHGPFPRRSYGRARQERHPRQGLLP